MTAMYKILPGVLIIFALSGLDAAKGKSSQTCRDTRNLLSNAEASPLNKEFIALFQTGDKCITDLVRALNDEDGEIRRKAQVVIRYLNNPEGVKALHEIYSKQKEITFSGPIPVPLTDWDYQFIKWLFIEHRQDDWGVLEFNYISALILDGSSRAKALLEEIEKARGFDPTTVIYFAKDVKQSLSLFPGETDLAKLVLNNSFFVTPEDRRYTTARLVALNGAKDKALVEVYINRGVLAEEWWHVVISKQSDGWRFTSFYQVAVS